MTITLLMNSTQNWYTSLSRSIPESGRAAVKTTNIETSEKCGPDCHVSTCCIVIDGTRFYAAKKLGFVSVHFQPLRFSKKYIKVRYTKHCPNGYICI